ncbi:hypothetical protein ACI7RC_09015 [Brevibacillus sp. B_LB10_24]|uniref:hypothetical protein n=1 Tax=Brevibacillus sp. B_LB10_24 TaxID=3380645 RepID=UPI0038B8CE8E
MAKQMVYYISWQEDDWLDELLDYFPAVNALVPAAKTCQAIKEQRQSGEVEQAVFVVNPAADPEETDKFLQQLTRDPELSKEPLYLVGVKEPEADSWRERYPQAKVVVISGYSFDFDYEAVLAQIEAEWGSRP